MYWNVYNQGTLKERTALNSNIRCIEIISLQLAIKTLLGWIVTLDVLKCYGNRFLYTNIYSWIVTLDVLKFSPAS